MGYFDPRDGRRKSDPLRSLDRAPAYAPDWQLHRVTNAQDTVFTEKKHGVNCGHYKSVRFAIVPYDNDPTRVPGATPGGSANPNVEVMIWSESAGEFLSFPTALTGTGVGAGDPYMVDVENANGAILFVAVTAAPGGVVAISAQGYEIDHTL
jgi:hypothetical protein